MKSQANTIEKKRTRGSKKAVAYKSLSKRSRSSSHSATTSRTNFRARYASAMGILSEINRAEIEAIRATTKRILAGQR